jgi:hypothetical protein
MQQNRSAGKKWFHCIFALLFVFTMLAPVKNIQAQDPMPPDPAIGPADVAGQQVYLPITFANYCSDFFDDFSDPNRGWSNGENDQLKAGVVNGEFQVTIKNSASTYFFTPPSCGHEKYIVETDVRWGDVHGATYGLVFAIRGDFDEFYSFEVNTDYQMYDFYHYVNDSWEDIYYHVPTSSIHSGSQTNHLAVRYIDQWATIFINGSQIINPTFIDTNSELTEAAVTVMPYSNIKKADVRFDNFSISTKNLYAGGPAYSEDLPSPDQAGDSTLPKLLEDRDFIVVR